MKRDERVVLIDVSADNRIRRLRARSLAEGREDVPFNSLCVGITERESIVSGGGRLTLTLGHRSSLAQEIPLSRPSSSPPRSFPSCHHACARGRSIVASLEY